MQAMLASKVPTTVDGKVQLLTTIEAMAARVKREALTGPLRSLETAIGIAQRYTLEDPEPEKESYDLSVLSDDELNDFYRLSAKASGNSAEEIERNLERVDGAADDGGDPLSCDEISCDPRDCDEP